MKQPLRGKAKAAAGPSQRRLRTGEIIRHALVEILLATEIDDDALKGVSVTISEARMSPDLRHATVFARPLGGQRSGPVVEALNRHARFIRGELGRHIDLKNTPDLRFREDESFEAAAQMDRLFDDVRVQRDLAAPPDAKPADE